MILACFLSSLYDQPLSTFGLFLLTFSSPTLPELMTALQKLLPLCKSSILWGEEDSTCFLFLRPSLHLNAQAINVIPWFLSLLHSHISTKPWHFYIQHVLKSWSFHLHYHYLSPSHQAVLLACHGLLLVCCSLALLPLWKALHLIEWHLKMSCLSLPKKVHWLPTALKI